MTSFVTHPLDFKLLKKRYVDWMNAGFPGADDNILPVLEVLASQDIVPVFSCESHPEDLDFHFYLLCAVNKKGLLRLQQIHSLLCDEMWKKRDEETEDWVRPELATGDLLSPLPQYQTNKRIWRYWQITTSLGGQTKDLFLEALRRACKEVIHKTARDQVLPRGPVTYSLVHKPTGRFYVGASPKLVSRMNKHRRDLEKGTHQNPGLSQCFTDWDDFKLTYRAYPTLQDAYDAEHRLLEEHVGTPNCCNTVVRHRHVNN